MSAECTADARLAEFVSDVQIPLDNLSYTIEEYLLANGTRLDIETRLLLAGIRDCADLIATRVRCIADAESRRAPAGRVAAVGHQACSSRSSSSSARL